MSFLRRVLGRQSRPHVDKTATPGDLLDHLEAQRPHVEDRLRLRHGHCPECKSDYLRVGAWARGGQAGWTVTCVNCGHLLERTVEIRR